MSLLRVIVASLVLVLAAIGTASVVTTYGADVGAPLLVVLVGVGLALDRWVRA